MIGSLSEHRPAGPLRGMLLLSLLGHCVLFSSFLLIFPMSATKRILLPQFYEVTLLSLSEAASSPTEVIKEPPAEQAQKQRVAVAPLKTKVQQTPPVKVKKERMADWVKKNLAVVKLPQEMVAVVPLKSLSTPTSPRKEKTPSQEKSLSDGEVPEWVKKNLAEITVPREMVAMAPARPQLPPTPPSRGKTPSQEKSLSEGEVPEWVRKDLAEITVPREMVAPVPLTPAPLEKTPPLPSQPAPSPPPQEVASLSPSVSVGIFSLEKNERFHFPEYLRIIQNKISGMWSFPSLDVKGRPYRVVVIFTLLSSGKIDRVEVEESSGNSFLDQAALRAVLLSNPLPPFPEGLEEKELKIHFGFILGRES